MIFVTVGTNEARFDRLIRALDALPRNERLIVQCGSSAVRPTRATCVDFLPFEDVVDHILRARVVVTHAGAGSVLVALANGKQPIVVPRLRRFGEAVDDHQVPFARRLAAEGLVTIVEDVELLPAAVAGGTAARPASSVGGPGTLATELRAYLSGVLSTDANAAGLTAVDVPLESA